VSCADKRTKFKITAIETTITAESVAYRDLAQNYKSYQGKYVDVKGHFGLEFEHFGICPDQQDSTHRLRCFWLSLDKNLNITQKDLDRMNGKMVRLKGLFDTTDKGHLNSYYGTISKIYFWEQQ
jgi:hypothetical protein